MNNTTISQFPASPAWVETLEQAKTARQLFIVAGVGKTTAYVSMHEKDPAGSWKQLLSTPGLIGKEGLGKMREGYAGTPTGTFRFNRAFGIADDPGCVFPYHKVTEKDYWSGDARCYNVMVNLDEMPDLDLENSEYLMGYYRHYQYCLNINYNEECVVGEGSAIFLHCFGPAKPFTGGCIAIPKEDMRQVLQLVRTDCVVVIDALENLSPETCREWGLRACSAIMLNFFHKSLCRQCKQDGSS